ncbi:MAG: peptidylprolyl isomerase, partial [Planctomycetota bacterium]
MINNLIILIVITCGLLVISGFFGSEVKSAPPGPALKVTATAEQNEVTIGDWIVITLTFTNTTAEKMDIIKPMLDIDSVSFLIKPGEGKKFVYSVITPSVYEHKKEQMARVSLAAGAQVQETFRIPAAILGLWEITAHYQGYTRLLSSEPLKINIVPPKADPPVGEASKPKEGELIAKIETSKGTMKCRFFFNDAPNTAMNFLRLSKENFYNKIKFHRIIKGFMIQSGCPKGDGTGSPGHSIKAEFNKNKHLKGTLSMARSQHNDSAGSQFFICLDAT